MNIYMNMHVHTRTQYNPQTWTSHKTYLYIYLYMNTYIIISTYIHMYTHTYTVQSTNADIAVSQLQQRCYKICQPSSQLPTMEVSSISLVFSISFLPSLSRSLLRKRVGGRESSRSCPLFLALSPSNSLFLALS